MFWLVLLFFACGGGDDDGDEPTGSAGAGGNGATVVEICDNGLDDDGDGDTDCADLSCSARAPDATAPTGFADSISWLHSAEAGNACGPLQQGVAEGALDPARVALIRGQVSDDRDAPRPGARVSVVGAPELGTVLTRGDGMFDIAVNGGQTVTLEVRDPDFLPVHRHANAPINDYAWVAPIALLPVTRHVTALSLGAGSAEQVLRAEPTEDASGVRRPTLIVPAGTQAMQQNADGTQTPLSNLSVRLTEYTVGERGPRAMPAELPPASAYTYAFELSVDEASSARGVAFDKPIPIYMENFLGFPTGTPVPVGFYNRETGAWEAVDDGVVLAIVAEQDGRAAIDVDGDGLPEAATALEAVGITAEEPARLAELYDPGQSLWRTTVTHFSTYDHNWPFGFPGDAVGPPEAGLGDGSTDTSGCARGSIIRVDNRSLGEALSLAGTGYTLFYQSDRTPGGHTRTIDVPVSESALPASLQRIDVTLEIAGQQHQRELPASPDQRFVFDWDGLNAYGFPIQGSQPFLLRVGYAYAGVYARSERAMGARTFGRPGEIRLEGNRTREEVSTVREIRGVLGGWDARGQSLGGFTLDVQHVYDPKSRTLLLGDGSERTSETVPLSLVDVLAQFEATPDQVLVHPDGRVFITEDTNGAIFQLANGELTVFAGGADPPEGIGDGGPATAASLEEPQGMALGSDGSLYVSEGTRIRRIDPSGIITTFAGGGGGVFQEGEPATAASLFGPDSLAFGPDGALYVAELENHTVRRIAPEGTLTTFAGTGDTGGELGDGGPATLAPLNSPSGLAFAPDGSLYISERFGNRIRRVTPDGIITTIAGTGTEGDAGDGEPALFAQLSRPRAIAFDSRGNLFISEQIADRVRQIGVDGIITTLVDAQSSDGALDGPDGIAVGPDDSVFVVSDAALLRVAQSLPGTSLSDLSVASADGAELYRFSRLGKHLSTLDTLTGAELRRFEYDAAGRLSAVVEENRRTTRIERTELGQPSAVVSPYGVRTELEVNAEGFLSTVRDAAGNSVALEYAEGGLLTRFIDERGGERTYVFENGRLVSARDPSGATQTLELTEEDGSQVVTRTSPLGRSTRHIRRRAENGGIEQRTEDPSGAVTVSVRNLQGDLSVSLPDGTQIETRFGPDPRFGAMAPVNRQTVVTLPSGLATTVSQTRAVQLDNANDPLSLARLSTETRVNDRVFLAEYDGASRTLVQTSPAGRQVTWLLDGGGRVAQVSVPGLEPSFYEYDGDGRPSAIVSGAGAGARRLGFAYTAEGWLGEITDALGHTTQYLPDAIGRTTTLTYADGASVAFAYDRASNLISLTPPGQAAHALSYDVRGLLEAYNPPELSSGATPTGHEYDGDGLLARLLLPGIAPVEYAYDESGLIRTISSSAGELTFSYDSSLRLASSSRAPDGVTLEHAYDGGRETLTRFVGPIRGEVAGMYDENSFLTSLSINEVAIPFEYDADGLVTQAGALTLRHDPGNGMLTGTSLNALEAAYIYSPRGELSSHNVNGAAGALYATTHTYDALGRIATTSETIDGTTATSGYAYDAVGQLVEVTTNGVVSAAFEYDDDGNRLSAQIAGLTFDATYDAQERLVRHGDVTYTYSPRGTLESRTTGGSTSSYTYDAFGNLTAVTLSDGRSVTYLTDARDRRIGRSINGVLERGWLYSNTRSPVAELDASGVVVSRFVYASNTNVPDFILRDGTTYGIVRDVRGSVRLIVDTATSEVVQRIDYGPFGEIISDSNPGFQPFGFAGGLYDADTGLIRFGARDYDPAVGRWTNKDPIRFRGGLNLYAYARNDPVNFVDPTGLAPFVSEQHFWYWINQFIRSDPMHGTGPTGRAPFVSEQHFWYWLRHQTDQAVSYPNSIDAFVVNYNDMRDADTIGADKYFHCMANCEAAAVGRADVAETVSDTREWVDEHIKRDPASACQDDQLANLHGRQSGADNKHQCRQACSNFRPPGLSPQY